MRKPRNDESANRGIALREKILNSIAIFASTYGYCPSVRDICAIVERSPGTVHAQLRKLARLSQDIENQEGSSRANAGGKTNGKMKAVRFGGNKGNADNATYSGKTWEGRKAAGAPSRHGTNGVQESAVGKKSGDLGFIGANARSVWSIVTEGYPGPHFAVMPRELARRCILAGSPQGGIILDPFAGTGTTLEVAIGCGRQYVGYEINPDYCELIRDRLGLLAGEISP